MKRNIIVILGIAILGAAIYGYKLYNKPHTNVAESDAMESLDADAIFHAFDSDEQAATKQYADQVIQVKGVLLEQDFSNSAEPQFVLECNSDDGFIRCGFKVEEVNKLKTITPGQSVIIKGICKGINSTEGLDLLSGKDVVLSSCIIIE